MGVVSAGKNWDTATVRHETVPLYLSRFGGRKENIMSNFQPVDEVAVDQRAETVTIQQPGFATTQQVTRDVAAERRLGWSQVSRIVVTLLVTLEILLGIRFVLHLISANPDSGFAVFIYGITGLFVAPFNGLVGTPASGGATLEVTTLIAMAVYALFVYILLRVLRIASDRPSARMVTRSTREEISPTGTEHDTHTTRTS
jgi:YggT family protein